MQAKRQLSNGWKHPVAWGLMLLVLTSLPAWVQAQVRVEIRAFESVMVEGDAFLKGESTGKPVLLAGELRIPGNGKDKVPAVVLMHVSGGINAVVEHWAQELNAMGVATFVPDSASGRGLERFPVDPPQTKYLQLIGDAYRALDLLAAHPRIDPNRIAIMGFSMGGLPARATSMERFRKAYEPAGVRFAAHISVYGACNTAFRDDDKVTGKPIRLFSGTNDDFAPVAPCRDLVARLKRAGADVTLTEFPGAQHYFDAFYLKKPVHVAGVATRRNCWLMEGEPGQIRDAKTGQPFDPNASCTEKGGSVAYDEAAAVAETAAVKEFLTNVFGLKR
jgi:dienelactone hydrolase